MKKNNSFIGVILAAGLGSRLRPLTNKIPKCLIKTAGKEILQYQIDSYVKAGIKKLIIITGYESSQIKNFVKNNKDLNIKLIVNDDYEVTNNMYSFYLAIKEIKGKPFILNNADLAIDKNIIGSILNHPSESGVAIDNSFFSKESMKVIVNLKGYIQLVRLFNVVFKLERNLFLAIKLSFNLLKTISFVFIFLYVLSSWSIFLKKSCCKFKVILNLRTRFQAKHL